MILDGVLFLVLAINVVYLLVFSLASLKQVPKPPLHEGGEKLRFALLIAAYKEDGVIEQTVRHCLDQDYPSDRYEVVVISDHMQPDTNERLRRLPIRLLQVDFDKSTNTRSLKAALQALDASCYDIALIIDADNLIAPSYLNELNSAFSDPKVEVVQTHRVAKNLNTDMAYLDAISEEVNNSIFRKGHNNLGMSAALIGSGMAFRYPLFYEAMMSNTSVGGFDRVLEMKLLYQGVYFHYLPHTYVKDEKIQRTANFYNQRRRWLAAQYDSLSEFVHFLLPALRQRRWDFCDKLFQQASFSRVLLLGFVTLFTLLVQWLMPSFAVKWWGLWALLVLALCCAVPRHYWTLRLLRAVCLVPWSFVLMFCNLFRMGEAKRRFIHTPHGIQS